MKNFEISGYFTAKGGTGDDIKIVLIYGNDENESEQIHQDSFSIRSDESGKCLIKFDNTFSLWTSKTVTFSLTISYDEDLIIPQVKAIYTALQNDYQIKYVDASISFPDGITQTILYPDDSLTLGHANCIDGTVLFASALEYIGIEPLIVLIPGHAFVGWRRWTGSNVAEFLETTMIGNSTFEDAYNEGNRRYFDVKYEEPFPIIIDVKYWRDKGLTPLMKVFK